MLVSKMIPWHLSRVSVGVSLFSLFRSSDTLYDMLNRVEEGEDRGGDVFLIPPVPGEDSDSYSGDEDEEVADLERLTGRVLRAQVEVRGEEEESDGEEEAGPPKAKTARKGAKKRKEEKWGKRSATLSSGHGLFPDRDATPYKDFQPHELFDLFLTEEMLDMIIHQSKLYARRKNNLDLQLSIPDLRVFLSILLLSGYNSLPRQQMYWEVTDDVHNEAVSKAMRRAKFLEIKRFLHFEEEVDEHDRFSKVRKVATLFQRACLDHFLPVRFLSHDECMIKYFGRSSLKQAIRLKPIRFGFKVWALCDPSGYLVAFELYQGANFGGDSRVDEELGKCSGTVIHLLDKVLAEDKFQHHQFHVMFDNLFTSAPLLRALKERSQDGTGTLRQNRLSNNPLSSVQYLKKQRRGTMEGAETTDKALKVTRWKDNQVVSVLSTVYGVEPKDNAKRWSREERKKIDVPRPAAIREYNKYMGGADRLNQNVNKYRVAINGKKFYWHIFTWILDVGMANAWTLHCAAGGKMDLLEFRRQVVVHNLAVHGTESTRPGPRIQRLGDEARLEGRDHWLGKVENEKRKRCAYKGCEGKDLEGRGPLSRFQCKKCGVGICVVPCHELHHTVP